MNSLDCDHPAPSEVIKCDECGDPALPGKWMCAECEEGAWMMCDDGDPAPPNANRDDWPGSFRRIGRNVVGS